MSLLPIGEVDVILPNEIETTVVPVDNPLGIDLIVMDVALVEVGTTFVTGGGSGTQGLGGPTGYTALGALGGHRLVVPTGTDQVEYADKDDLTDISKPVWLTTGAASGGASVSLHFYGQITEASWTWSVGPIYVGDDGVMTQVAPSTGYIRQVAWATEATTIWFEPQVPITLV